MSIVELPVARWAERAAVPWRLRLQHIWVLMTLQVTFVAPASTPIVLPDIWWTLKSGEWMVDHHQLLVADPFTTAPPAAAQLNAQWLAQLAYYALYRLGGLEAVIMGTALAAMGAFAFVLAASHERSARLRLSCAATLGGYLLAISNLGERPQTLAYPLFGLFLLTTVRAQVRGTTRLLWLLPLATALWANLHGSYTLGLLLLGCSIVAALAERQPRRAILTQVGVLVGCVLATGITPYGFGSLAYVGTIGGSVIIRNFVTEWAPTSIATPEGVLFFGSLGVVGTVMLASRARLRPFDWLLLAVFAALAISSVRAVVWWGLAVCPVLAYALGGLRLAERQEAHPTPERPALNLILALALILTSSVALPWLKPSNPLLPPAKRGLVGTETPVAVAEFLKTQTYPGRMFNHEGWGGYFDWTLWPQHAPFVDGRIELHPPEVWFDYLLITYPAPEWRELLERNDVGYLVLSKEKNRDLIEIVQASPEAWRMTYDDGQAVVFVRASESRPAS